MALDNYKTLVELLADQLSLDESEITSESALEELGADSLDMMDLLMRIEDEFGVSVPDDEVANIKTVGDICDYLESHIK